MRYGSVCSGIEAKACAKCAEIKPLDDFHQQGKDRRHSWCRKCFNTYQRSTRVRSETPEQKRRHNLQARYGITPAEVDAIQSQQGGVCAICGTEPKRWVVDHCHNTGQVRGLLCHRCNIAMGGWDDPNWMAAAMRYRNK